MLSSGVHSSSAAAAPLEEDESGSPASSSSAFTSHIPHPTSDIPRPRRSVPLLFDPCINDEANIFEALGESRSSIVDLAFEYKTTVSAFSMWLMREDVQAKLSAVTAVGACATRIGAVTQLPEAVGAMVLQIRGCISDETHRLSKPGLEFDKMQDRRRTTARRAAHMLLRLATFDPSRPLYRRRVERENVRGDDRAVSPVHDRGDSERHEAERAFLPTSPKGEVPPQAGEGARVFSTSSSRRFAPTSDITAQPSILDLCSAAMTALANSRFSNLAYEPIRAEPLTHANGAYHESAASADSRVSSRAQESSSQPLDPNHAARAIQDAGGVLLVPASFTSDIRHRGGATSHIPSRAPPAD